MSVVAILTFLGLLVGLLISRYTKEEIKSGTKYFLVIYKVLIFLLLLISLYFAWFITVISLIIAFIAGIVFNMGLKQIYFYLGILFILSSWQNTNIFYVSVTLIFIIGLLRGSLIGNKFSKYKNIRNRVIISAIVFAIPFILLYFKDNILVYSNLIFAFISGAFFMEFIRKIDL